MHFLFSICIYVDGQALLQGQCITIFPEGISFWGPSLQKFRTGTARIALEAATRSNGITRPVLVPCGLNYTNPQRFRR